MRSPSLLLCTVLLPLVLACSRPDAEPERTAEPAPPAAAESPAAEAEAPAPAPERPGRAREWTVTAAGFGPVTLGMTLAEAGEALGAPLALPAGAEECAYVRPERPGVAFMVREGRIARIDVDGGGIRTAEGAAVGTAEEQVRSFYEQVEVRPHKYTDGHYLVVTPVAPAESGNRLVFETDGRQVVRYRSGRLPEVEWVEGCS